MATKKTLKTAKRTINITGKDASMLSFVARNGALPAERKIQFEGLLSPGVRRIVFASKNSGKMVGKKTLVQMRKLAERNSDSSKKYAVFQTKKYTVFKTERS
jgi:hypothetical protein